MTPINSIKVNGTTFYMSERTFADVTEGARIAAQREAVALRHTCEGRESFFGLTADEQARLAAAYERMS